MKVIKSVFVISISLLSSFLPLSIFKPSLPVEFLTKAYAQDAQSYLNSAQNYLNKGDLENATLNINKILKMNAEYPLNMLSFMMLGVIEDKKESYSEAIKYYTKSINIILQKEDRSSLGGLYGLRAKSKKDNKDFSGAIKDYTLAIENDGVIPGSGWLFERAYSKMGINDHKGAIDDFTDLIDLDPNKKSNATVYILRGYNKFLMNDLKGNCLDLKKAEDLGGVTIDNRNILKEEKKKYKCSLYEIDD